MSYNLNENISNNHYNCPVVAYYPQVIGISVPEIESVNFIQCFIDLNYKRQFKKKILTELSSYFPTLTKKQISQASKVAFDEYHRYIKDLKAKGQEIIKNATKMGIDVIVLCGRPYHADPKSITEYQLISGMNKAVISDDSLPRLATYTAVLNQWTYHARMYSAAKYVCKHDNLHLVQLVSLEVPGLDAVTSDEVRRRWSDAESYTQLKIDEITNLGAVKIRLRSMFAALEKL